jgi:NAD(P)-dependent dehydrogenase (short-subunit alcohol dehydrogenase family)
MTSDRLVLVTGGSRGIGAATAVAAARRGWSVLLTYRADAASARSVVDRCAGLGVRADAVRFDAADLDAIDPLFAQVDAFGVPLRGLVNNAGISTLPSMVADMSTERLRSTMVINSLSPMLVAREGVRRMAISRGGSGGAIVNVSSRLSELGAPGRHVDYATSKAAVDGFTRGLGREVVGDGVRVNGVRPGVIDTEIHASIGEPGRAQQVGSTVPIGRPGRAEEVADTIIWLLSDEASYISACLVEVSGGR